MILSREDLNPKNNRIKRHGQNRGTDACSMSNDSGFTTLSGEDEDLASSYYTHSSRRGKDSQFFLSSSSAGSNLNEFAETFDENIRITSEELKKLWSPNLLRIQMARFSRVRNSEQTHSDRAELLRRILMIVLKDSENLHEDNRNLYYREEIVYTHLQLVPRNHIVLLKLLRHHVSSMTKAMKNLISRSDDNPQHTFDLTTTRTNKTRTASTMRTV